MAVTEETRRVATARVPGRRRLLAGITPQSRFYWLRILVENPAALGSGFFLLTLLALSFIGPLVSPYDAYTVNPVERLRSPSGQHWFGTDQLGRDVLVRLLHGARVSLIVGVSATAATVLLGSLLGLLAGYYSRLDAPIMRFLDGLMAFPSILLAIAIMASLGPATINVIVALTVVYTPSIARVVRGMVLLISRLPYVESARSVGVRDPQILWRYVYTNALSPVIVQGTFIVAYAIIAEASLSFLGAGVPPETPTWGNMLRDGQQVITRAWWLTVFPGAALFTTVLALNLLGDGLRDALDPRVRKR